MQNHLFRLHKTSAGAVIGVRSYYCVVILAVCLATGCKPVMPVSGHQSVARQQTREVLLAQPEATKSDKSDVTDELSDAALIRLQKNCGRQDFEQFFDDFVRFKPVRDRYTSPRVDERTNNTAHPYVSHAKSALTDPFRIALVDNLYVTSVSRHEASAPLGAVYDRLEITPKLMDDETYRVDYAQAHFRDTEDGGEQVADTYGLKGSYVFKLQNGCWYLTKDLRK